MNNLKDKVIIVTGGTSGMGAASSLHFAELGAKVVAASIQREEGVALEKQITDNGGEGIFAYVDVSDEESVKRMVEETTKKLEKAQEVKSTIEESGKVIKSRKIKLDEISRKTNDTFISLKYFLSS